MLPLPGLLKPLLNWNASKKVFLFYCFPVFPMNSAPPWSTPSTVTILCWRWENGWLLWCRGKSRKSCSCKPFRTVTPWFSPAFPPRTKVSFCAGKPCFPPMYRMWSSAADNPLFTFDTQYIVFVAKNSAQYIEKPIDTLKNIVYNTDADAKRIKKRMSASVLFFCALGCGKIFLHFLFLTTISCV